MSTLILSEKNQQKVIARRSLPNTRLTRKEIAGKKGDKNKYPYRPARGKETSPTGTITCTEEEQANTNPLYTEIYHNENPFILMFLTDGAKRCKSCHLDFCHRKKVIPFDLIFSHKERWMFPVNGDWSNCRPSRQETVRYYHATKKCLTKRFPFFRLTTWKFLMMLTIAFKIHTRTIWHSNKTWDYVPVCELTFLVLVPQLPYNSFELSIAKSWAKAA